jgi:predicted RNA methylase
MTAEEIRIDYQGKPVYLMVRPNTQDEPMARTEVFHRDYYRQYGKLEIKPGDTVVDLGANVGSFSILAGMEGAETIVAVEATQKRSPYSKRTSKGIISILRIR